MDYIDGVNQGVYRKRGREAKTFERTIIGENIIILRHWAGLTQDELSVKAGLSEHTIAVLESGQVQDPRVSTLMAIADALGFRLNYICYPKESLKLPYE